MVVNKDVTVFDVDFDEYCKSKPESFKIFNVIDCSRSSQLKTIGIKHLTTILQKLKIILPKSVESLEKQCFFRIDLEGFDEVFKKLTLGEECFGQTGADSIKLRVTEGPMIIKKWAFRESRALEIKLESNGKTVIEEGCFSDCYTLRAVTLDFDLEVLPKDTFKWCNNLKRIVLPRGLKVIKEEAFGYCKQLRLLMLPDSVESISSDAFLKCSGDLIIRFLGREWKLPDFLSLVNSDKGTLRERALKDVEHSTVSVNNFVVKDRELIINEGIEVFTDNVEANVKVPIEVINKVTIPNTLRVLDAVFTCFTKLEVVEVPKDSKLVEIGEECFRDCSNLREFNFPKSIAVIGYAAFSGTGLKNVTIEAESLTLNMNCFSKCCNLESVAIRSVKKDSLFVFNHGCFSKCRTLREAVFDCNSLDLPCFFLNGDKQLQVLKLPRSIKMINFQALSGCKSLEFLKLPDSVVRIQESLTAEALSKDLMIEYLGFVWDKDVFHQVLLGHREELERDGVKLIDEDSKYYDVFSCTNSDRIELVEEFAGRQPITLGEFIRGVYPEEFAVLNSRRCETLDTIEETSLF